MDEVICFDMDNTLIRSDRTHLIAFKRAFEMNGLPKVPKDKMLSLFGIAGKEFVRKIFPHLSDRDVSKVIKNHDDIVVNDTSRYARAFPGVKRALKDLKRHYRLALLSNVKHAEILATLDHAGIPVSTFDVVVGADEVRHAKPAPDAIKLAMRRLKAKGGYMVGDTVYDLQAGKAAGLKIIAVLTGHHSRSKLKKEGPLKILGSVSDLPGFLIR